MPQTILLQTTIATAADDWHVGRFSLLRDFLASRRDSQGRPLYRVTARDRSAGANGDDPVLAGLAESDVDQLWLLAVDVGDGLSAGDVAGIEAFRRRGGGILTARDHQDLGISLLGLGTIGASNFFHSRHCEVEPERCARDDTFTTAIDFPNYHSGSNGDYQTIEPSEPLSPLLRSAKAADGTIRQFPAHPHEGAVSCAGLPFARTIARGTSTVTGRQFDLAIAFEGERDAGGAPLGRVVSESTFHHFCDYNWNTSSGAPSFVAEPPGDAIARDPRPLEAFKDYVGNVAAWLTPGSRVR